MKENTNLVIQGMHVVTSLQMTEPKQLKFPRSRKKRIKKKWRKLHTIQVPREDAFIMKGVDGRNYVMCHPTLLPKFREAAKAFG